MLKQAINKVRSRIECYDKLFWALPIVSELEKLNIDLMIQWLAKCLQIYLSEFGHSKFAEFNKYVEKALNSSEKLTALQCQKISQEIWYLPERDNIQISLSHLWSLLSSKKLGYNGSKITQANLAVTKLIPEAFNDNLCSRSDLFNKYLDAALEIYEEYQSKEY
jgi:hypothetical protein